MSEALDKSGCLAARRFDTIHGGTIGVSGDVPAINAVIPFGRDEATLAIRATRAVMAFESRERDLATNPKTGHRLHHPGDIGVSAITGRPPIKM